MRIKGKEIRGPAIEVVVFPRQTGNIAFKVQAVLDFSDFDKLCPVPQPPQVLRPGGIRSQDVNDKDFRIAVDKWATSKANWLVLKSMSITEDLEWETIDPSNPETWSNYQKELTEAGFTPAELVHLISKINNVNGLDEERIEEATKAFLVIQAALPKE